MKTVVCAGAVCCSLIALAMPAAAAPPAERGRVSVVDATGDSPASIVDIVRTQVSVSLARVVVSVTTSEYSSSLTADGGVVVRLDRDKDRRPDLRLQAFAPFDSVTVVGPGKVRQQCGSSSYVRAADRVSGVFTLTVPSSCLGYPASVSVVAGVEAVEEIGFDEGGSFARAAARPLAAPTLRVKPISPSRAVLSVWVDPHRVRTGEKMPRIMVRQKGVWRNAGAVSPDPETGMASLTLVSRVTSRDRAVGLLTGGKRTVVVPWRPSVRR